MTKPASVEIRLLASPDEYRACVALQHEIWGRRFDVVPAAVLQISAHVGAVIAGAFAPDGQLVGFVFGLSGVGETGAIVHWPLHHGLPTDRFVVACDTSCVPSAKPLTPDDDEMCVPLLSARRQPGDPAVSNGSALSPRLRIEIPTDFARLLVDSPDEARRWHETVREHFLWALDRGYSVAGIRQDPTTSRSFYLLEVRP